MTSNANAGSATNSVILSEAARASASYAVEGPRRSLRRLHRSSLSNQQSRCRCRH